MNHYKDLCQTTSIIERSMVFFVVQVTFIYGILALISGILVFQNMNLGSHEYKQKFKMPPRPSTLSILTAMKSDSITRFSNKKHLGGGSTNLKNMLVKLEIFPQ